MNILPQPSSYSILTTTRASSHPLQASTSNTTMSPNGEPILDSNLVRKSSNDVSQLPHSAHNYDQAQDASFDSTDTKDTSVVNFQSGQQISKSRDDGQRASSDIKKFFHADNGSDFKVLNYYKGLMNDSLDSLGNDTFNALTSEDTADETTNDDLNNLHIFRKRLNSIPSVNNSFNLDQAISEGFKRDALERNDPLNNADKEVPEESNNDPQLKTPTINNFQENVNNKNNPNVTTKSHDQRKELSPLVFLESPAQARYVSKEASVMEPVNEFGEDFDLRSINDTSGYKFAFQYFNANNNTFDEHSNALNGDNGAKKIIESGHNNIVGQSENITNHETSSIDEVPYMKNASMSDYDFEDIIEPAKIIKPELRKSSRTSLTRLTRSNTAVTKDMHQFTSPQPSTSGSSHPTRPMLKNVKSLPQLPRLNSLSIKRKNTITQTMNDYSVENFMQLKQDDPLKYSPLLTSYNKTSNKPLVQKPSIASLSSQQSSLQNSQISNLYNFDEPVHGYMRNKSSGKSSHSRFNSNSSSMGKNSSIGGYSSEANSNSSSNFRTLFSKKNLAMGKHQKSSSNSVAEMFLKGNTINNNNDNNNNNKNSGTNNSDNFEFNGSAANEALPRLNTSESSTNILGKLRTGIKKFSPVTPKHQTFQQAIDESLSLSIHNNTTNNTGRSIHETLEASPTASSSPGSGFSIKAKSLAKKASLSNLHRNKSTRIGNRSKSNTITSTATNESNNSGLSITIPRRPVNNITSTLNNSNFDSVTSASQQDPKGIITIDTVDTAGATGTAGETKNKITVTTETDGIENLITSPIVKVNALSSNLASELYIENENRSVVDLVADFDDTNHNKQQLISGLLPLLRERAFRNAERDASLSSSATGTIAEEETANIKPKAEFSLEESVKTFLINELTNSIEQMHIEDSAFEMTQNRLIESGWYSDSNINDIKSRRDLNRQRWQYRVNSIKSKLDKINEANRKKDYNIRTPKRQPQSQSSDSSVFSGSKVPQKSEMNNATMQRTSFYKSPHVDPQERFEFETF